MPADLRALLAEVRALAEAARALHVRLDEMQPHLEDVCAIAHVHGAPYCGPRWADERATMEAALAVVEARLLALAEGEGAACRHSTREVVTAMTCLDCGSLVPLAESVRQALASPPPAERDRVSRKLDTAGEVVKLCGRQHGYPGGSPRHACRDCIAAALARARGEDGRE